MDQNSELDAMRNTVSELAIAVTALGSFLAAWLVGDDEDLRERAANRLETMARETGELLAKQAGIPAHAERSNPWLLQIAEGIRSTGALRVIRGGLDGDGQDTA